MGPHRAPSGSIRLYRAPSGSIGLHWAPSGPIGLHRALCVFPPVISDWQTDNKDLRSKFTNSSLYLSFCPLLFSPDSFGRKKTLTCCHVRLRLTFGPLFFFWRIVQLKLPTCEVSRCSTAERRQRTWPTASFCVKMKQKEKQHLFTVTGYLRGLPTYLFHLFILQYYMFTKFFLVHGLRYEIWFLTLITCWGPQDNMSKHGICVDCFLSSWLVLTCRPHYNRTHRDSMWWSTCMSDSPKRTTFSCEQQRATDRQRAVESSDETKILCFLQKKKLWEAACIQNNDTRHVIVSDAIRSRHGG